MKEDLSKSLNELEHEGRLLNIADEGSFLVSRCLELRDKPLKSYTIEDLRLMIGQGIGLSRLVPLAIKKLADNIFSEGDLYAGDLLVNVLKIEPQYWASNKSQQTALIRLLEEKLPSGGNHGIPKSVLKVAGNALLELKKTESA